MFAATGARKRALSIQQSSRVNLSDKSVHLRPQSTRSRSLLDDPRKPTRLVQSIVLLVILVLFVLPKIHLNWFHHQPPRPWCRGRSIHDTPLPADPSPLRQSQNRFPIRGDPDARISALAQTLHKRSPCPPLRRPYDSIRPPRADSNTSRHRRHRTTGCQHWSTNQIKGEKRGPG